MLRNSKFKSFVWYGSVGLLVLFAVAATLFRILFASVEEYRERLEQMAGSYLGQPITISDMDARVVGISPTVIFKGVALLQQDGETLLSRFDAISVALDPIASLANGQPIIELIVSGANLEVSYNPDGSFGVQGLALAQRQPANEAKETGRGVQGADGGKALGAWFLSQGRLALRNSRITLYYVSKDERFTFDDVELELRNSENRHQLNGFVNLPTSIGSELSVAADIEGDLLQKNGWGGDIYVKTAQLNPRQWLHQSAWQGSSLREGMLDLELWSHWQEGRLAEVSSRFLASGLLLSRDENLHAIPRIAADARLQRVEAGWRLDVRRLRVQQQLMQQLDLLTPMQLQLEKQGEALSLRAQGVELGAFVTLLPFLPQLEEGQREMVRQMSPSGVVEELRLDRSAGKLFTAAGRVRGFSAGAWEKLPGVSGIDADFSFVHDRGRLALSSSEGGVELPRLFRAPLSLGAMQAELALQRETDGWRLLGDGISISSQDLDARVGVELVLAAGSPPWMSLQGRFSAPDARVVPHYLPANIMKEKGVNWLDHAFLAGRVPRGTLQYHGYLNQFPFKEQQGRFEVLFDAEAVQLHYHDGWPDLQQLTGEVHFDGPGMTINATGARIFDARLGPTRVSIDDFKAARLLVDGGAALSVADGLRFLRESPLGQKTGGMIDKMSGSGDAVLALQLAIPISPVVSKRYPLKVEGRVDFARDRLDVTEGVSLQQVNGSLNFTERTFTADGVTAQLFGKPAALMVMTEEGAAPKVMVVARGRATIPALAEQFPLPLFDYLRGEGEWQASLTLPRGAKEGGVTLQINSDLDGVASTLPAPLGKVAESRQEMRLKFYLSGNRLGERRFTFGKEMGLIWREAEQHQLRRAQLRLGAALPLKMPSSDRVEVVGRGGKVDLSSWLAVLHKLRGEGGGGAPLPVVVAMQQLHLLKRDGPQHGFSEGGRLPPLTFEVKAFSYDGMALGKVAFKLVPGRKQNVVEALRVESPLYTLSGDGGWSDKGGSRFSFALEAPSLEKMMNHFGFATVIQGAKTHVKGSLAWPGDPTAFSLGELNAKLQVNLQEGSIVDVEPGAGRMLGILSIPALPRRLFLDFSDVFKKGLAFSEIKGDITIDKGQAYTSNLRLESAPASILVSGRTGLLAQDFDQDIYVVPNVSDTATIASALAWGPQVAAVVALFQELFKSDIKTATMSRYHISGSWSKPVIKRIVEQQPGEPKGNGAGQPGAVFTDQ